MDVINNIYNWIISKVRNKEIENEIILLDNPNRLVIFPIVFEDIWKLYKKAEASFWVPGEIDFSKDVSDIPKLNESEKKMLDAIVAFFALADRIVNENLFDRIIREVKILESNYFYIFQMMIENIHSQVYNMILDLFFPCDIDGLYDYIINKKSIRNKANWVSQIINSKRPFCERLFASILVEGLFFPGSFAIIFWIKKKGILHGLTTSNEFISRDEALHVDHGCLLFKHIINRPKQIVAHEIISEAVDIEKKFMFDIIPDGLIGMNYKLMDKYIEYLADNILSDTGYDKLYNSKNPFDFMENISLDGKTNFFEKNVSEYQKLGSIKKINNFDIDTTEIF